MTTLFICRYIALLIVFYSALEPTLFFFFFQAEDGIRDDLVTGVQTCALPIFFEAQNLTFLSRNQPTQYGCDLRGDVTSHFDCQSRDTRPTKDRPASTGDTRLNIITRLDDRRQRCSVTFFVGGTPGD